MKKMTMIVSAILTAAMLVTPMSAFAVDLPAPQFNPNEENVREAVGDNNTFVPEGWIENHDPLSDTPYNIYIGEAQQVEGTNRGNAVVRASVNPTYTVTIPMIITLGAVEQGDDAGKFKGTFDITASNVFLEEGKGIMVSLVSEEDNEFTMRTGEEGYLLDYTVKSEVYGDVNKQKRNLAIFATDNDLLAIQTAFAEQDRYRNALNYVQTHYSADAKEFRESVTIQTVKPLYAGVYRDTVTFNIGVADVQGEVLNAFNSVGQQ